MAFSGFERDQVTFFRQLAARQDREWFRQNKERFQSVAEGPMRELIGDLHAALTRQYKGFALKPPKHFRIYRDTRFSKDKSPFKTGVSAVIALQGSEEEARPPPSTRTSAPRITAGAGHWHLPSGKVERYRKLVAGDKSGRELQKRIGALKKRASRSSHSRLEARAARIPGRSSARRLLKLKGIGISFPAIPASVRFSPRLAPWLQARSAEAATLVTSLAS